MKPKDKLTVSGWWISAYEKKRVFVAKLFAMNL
jgi:hypothetical protein